MTVTLDDLVRSHFHVRRVSRDSAHVAAVEAWDRRVRELAEHAAHIEGLVSGVIHDALTFWMDGGAAWCTVGENEHGPITLSTWRSGRGLDQRTYLLRWFVGKDDQDEIRVCHSNEFALLLAQAMGAVIRYDPVEPDRDSGKRCSIRRPGNSQLMAATSSGQRINCSAADFSIHPPDQEGTP